MVWLNDSRSDVPAPTLSVATSPAVEEPESPLTTTLVKVQPARAFSSKTRLEPAAGRPLKVNVLLLPVPPAVVIETGLGTTGLQVGRASGRGAAESVEVPRRGMSTTQTVA